MKRTATKIKLALFIPVSLMLGFSALSQESLTNGNCDNGLDDDFNGLIDQFDPGCQTTYDCFVEGEEQDFNAMAPEIHCTALLESPSAYSSPIAGDVDNDGVVEIILLNHQDHELVIISGEDCSEEAAISFPIPSFETKAGNVALGDVDGDGYTDIFVAHGRGTFDAQAIRRIEFDGTSYNTIWDVSGVATADRKHLDIIDINRDGIPEIIPNGGFMVNSIDGSTYGGALPSIENRGKGLYAFTADADAGNNGNEGDVELVLGVSIYRYDFTANTWNLIRDIPALSTTWNDKTKVSLADMDLDGDIDAVACNHDSNEYLVWDLQTTDIVAQDNYLGPPGISRVSIGNFDDDPEPEFVFIHYNTLEVIDDVVNSNAATLGFSNLWSLSITDPSAHTQVTLFDFDADGKKEVVYRGETELYVYRGEADGFGNAQEIYNSGANTIASETGIEYPVIVDANGDGQANILTIGDGNSGLGEGLHIYKSSGLPWAPARKIWNTQAYVSTNVNDDGTIPSYMQENYLVYNDFLSQHGPFSPLPPNQTPTADITINIASGNGNSGIIYDNCPDLGLAVELCNQGDVDLESSLNVEVYDGDPFTNNSAVYVGSYNLTTPIDTGTCVIDTIFFTVNVSSNYDFHFYINQEETTGVYPIDETTLLRNHLECDYNNNSLAYSFSCNQEPQLTNDNATACEGSTITVDILANDTDPNNNFDLNTLTIVTGALNGNSSIVGGQLEYTTNPGYLGTETITYEISDLGVPVYTEQATVTIEVIGSPDTGEDTTVDLCTNQSPVDMISLLNGTPEAGGTWTTQANNPHSENFDPSFELSQILTYSITSGAGSCATSSTELTINVISSPNAGTGGDVTFCSADNPTNMLTLLTGVGSSSGSWIDEDDNGVSPIFNPGVSDDGIYTYILPGVNSCPADSAFLSITTEEILNPGDDSSLSVCEDSPVQTLFTSLGGTPDGGGFWLDPSDNLHSGSLNPAMGIEGTYTYVISATTECPETQAELDVTIIELLNPGDDTVLDVCRTEASFNLFDEIDGNPDTGGYWLDPAGNPHSGNINPATSLSGDYTYNLDMPLPCHLVSSTVTLNLNSEFSAGSDNSLEFCTSDPSESMLSLLNGSPDANGTWALNGANISITNLNPATAESGNYTYTVPVNGACTSQSANLDVTIYTAPNAGDDMSINLCNSLGTINLSDYLSADAQNTGDWIDNSNNVISSNQSISTSGSYFFRYLVPAVGSCPQDISQLQITSQQQLSAGNDGDLVICETENSYDLVQLLSDDAILGGNWYAPLMNPHSGDLNPTSDPSGTYTYEVISPSSCPNPTAEFEITIEELPDAGEDGGTAFYCDVFPGFDLIDNIPGSPQVNGFFTDPSGSIVNDFTSPAAYESGIYTYHATPENVCPETTSTLSVTISNIGSAGTDTQVTLCDNTENIDLTSLLEGNPEPGGQWIDMNNQSIPTNFTPNEPTTLEYIYGGGFPCPTLNADLVISLSEMKYAGSDNSISSCENDQAFDLSQLLSPDASANGNWQDPNGNTLTTSQVTPGASPDGDYLYLTSPNTSCPQDSAVITVATQLLPNAGEDGFLLVCSIDDPVDLISYLSGNPDNGGTWLAPDNSAVDPIFDPNNDIPGTYTYEVSGIAPCPTTAASASVTVQYAPDAGEDVFESLCTTSETIELQDYNNLNSLQPTHWVNAEFQEVGAPVVNPIDSLSQQFYLVATGSGPCMDDTASYTINVEIPSNISIQDPILLCNEHNTIDLLDYIEADFYEEIIFRNENYEVLNSEFNPMESDSQEIWAVAHSNAPCPSDSTLISITVNSPANPGLDTLINACSTDGPFNIESVMGGNPDEGGSFVWMNDTSSTLIFDPSLFSGSHFVEYIAPEVEPCNTYSSWLQIDIHQTPEPTFTINDEDAELSNPIYYFDNETSGTYNFTWDYGGLGTAFTYDGEFTFPEDVPEAYLVCLHADNLMGCEAFDCQVVEVKDVFTHFIPNTFTPNGDGDNDVFLIVGRGIDTDFFELYIYSRNGDQVFHTTDITEGWDGTWYGEEVPTDMYSYRVVMKAKDTSERVERLGNINVLR